MKWIRLRLSLFLFKGSENYSQLLKLINSHFPKIYFTIINRESTRCQLRLYRQMLQTATEAEKPQVFIENIIRQMWQFDDSHRLIYLKHQSPASGPVWKDLKDQKVLASLEQVWPCQKCVTGGGVCVIDCPIAVKRPIARAPLKEKVFNQGLLIFQRFSTL